MDLLKHRGSVVTWALHWGLEDAYLVWTLARKFSMERSRSGKATGRLSSPYFLTYLSRSMSCQKKTAKKRLREAIDTGFLVEDHEDSIIITNPRNMYKKAIDAHECGYEDKLTNFRTEFIFANDREYTIPFIGMVDINKYSRNRALMYRLLCVHGSRYLMSRHTHAKLLRCSRNTTIRLAHTALSNELQNYILLDVMSLLHKPLCGSIDAICAFQDAENIYRSGNQKARGRKILHCKTVKLDKTFKTFLTIQLPNSYTSNYVVREVCLGRGRSWFSGSDRSGCESDDDYTPAKKTMSDGGRALCSSKDLGNVAVPDSIVQRYMGILANILDVDECRSHILNATGAQNIRPVGVLSPSVWRSKVFVRRDTPSLSKKRSDQLKNECSSLL